MDLDIQREDGPQGGRWVCRFAGGAEAELTYVRRADGLLDLDHTRVPPAFEGRGVAAALVRRAVDDIRREGGRIIPSCSYVAAAFGRHPEWADLLP